MSVAEGGVGPRAELRRDQEDVRLVTGFADIFAAVVLVGVLVALIGLAGNFIGAGAGLLAAVAAWYLPVPLVERRQFAACALVLAGAFALSVALPAFALLEIFGALPVAGAMYFYWQRHRIPLAAAIGIGAAVAFPALVILRYGFEPGDPLDDVSALTGLPGWVGLGVGLTLFAIAMRWDWSDRDRLTRRSDVAFWLHVMAGPLAVHGLFSLLGVGRFDTGGINPWPVIGLFGLFTVTALVIDRRPLLLSSFGYFLFAFGQIVYRQMAPSDDFASQAVSVPQAVMVATLGGGLLVAILAAGWSTLRGYLLQIMPAEVADRVPPASAWTPPSETSRAGAQGESEPVRLVLGLNDYLASLGLGVLFLGGLAASYVIVSDATKAAISGHFGRDIISLWSGLTPWLALAVPLAIVLLASEVFVRRQRMALTAVGAATLFAFLTMLGGLLALWQIEGSSRLADQFASNPGPALPISALTLVLVCLGGVLVNLAFGWFNRIPVAAAYAALALLPLLFIDVIQAITVSPYGSQPDVAVEPRLLMFGLAAFIAALVLDRSDPGRTTQRADIGFWLHLLASLFAVAVLFRWAAASPMQALMTLGLYVLLVIAAVFINRRAPLIVGIPFVLAAIDLPDIGTRMLVQLVFFAALMALVLMWDKLRSRALGLFGR
jgi:hypothetical protein